MRAALIILPPAEDGKMLSLAGKSIAERQLMFARECGCEAVIAHGSGVSPGAIGLRHAAEKAGMRFQVISSSHALAGAIDDDDTLLVLQPDMLPESRQAVDLLRAEGHRMLIVSAGPGAAAGFERIDLDRAWAGALTLPGRWLSNLSSLPEDAASHAALLRIALQQKLPEARLDDAVLDDGRWMVVPDASTAQAREASWLRAHVGNSPATSPSRWLAEKFVGRAGAWMLDRPFMRVALLTLSLGLLGSAMAAGRIGQPVLAFALLALSAPVLESFLALSRLAVAPFGKVVRWPWLRKMVDAALLALAIIVIDSLWYRAVFPAFVLVAGLLFHDRNEAGGLMELARDRALVAGAVAVLCAFLPPEVAIILVSTVLLAIKLLPLRPRQD